MKSMFLGISSAPGETVHTATVFVSPKQTWSRHVSMVRYDGGDSILKRKCVFRNVTGFSVHLGEKERT